MSGYRFPKLDNYPSVIIFPNSVSEFGGAIFAKHRVGISCLNITSMHRFAISPFNIMSEYRVGMSCRNIISEYAVEIRCRDIVSEDRVRISSLNDVRISCRSSCKKKQMRISHQNGAPEYRVATPHGGHEYGYHVGISSWNIGSDECVQSIASE